MDPISALGLVSTAVQLTNSCLKVCRKFLGPSKHDKTYIQAVYGEIMDFNGSLKSLEDHYRIFEESDDRSIKLSSIEKPMSVCEKTLESLQGHLESKGFVRKIINGARLDTVLERHLKCLKNSRNLLHELLQMDQTAILHALEKYSLDCAKDIRDLQETIGEMDERSRRDLEQVHGSLGSIHDGQMDILRSHEDSRARGESEARAKKDLKVVDWLSTLSFEAKQSDVLRSCVPESVSLFPVEALVITLNNDKAGAGKTVFTSIVVHHLEGRFKGSREAISYAYCSYKNEATQNPTSLIASILQQILRKPMAVSDDLRALYDQYELKNIRPTIEELSVQLQAYVCNLEKFFVVIDALDECPEVKWKEFLHHVRKLQPAVSLMITTRPTNHVKNEFPEAACVEIRAKDTDIQSYCYEKIRSDHRLHLVQADADLMDLVVNTIAENAQKMFLLAVLHIESLASQLNKAAVRNALKRLPQGLDDTYDEALRRIDRQGQPSRELAYQVLSWISYAYMPLTVGELRCALAVTPGHFTFDVDAMTPERTVVSVCAGLVTIDPKSNIIRLVHYTTQEFFERIRDSRFPTAQANITLICLTYLSFDLPSYGDIEYRDKTLFFPYATQYWRDHMRATPLTGINYVNELIIQTLLQPRKLQALLDHEYERKRPRLGPLTVVADSKVPPLCAAIILGLESLVVLLLGRGADSTKSVIGDGETALHTAAYFAQLEVMKILIDHGASVNGHVWTPLSGAISSIYFRGNGMANEEGAVAAVRLLLARGADVDLQSDYQYGYTFSPLIQAAMTGSIQLVELLLKYGADVHVRFWHGLTVLHKAHSGKPGMFQLLIDHGADLHACDDYGESPLLRVCHDYNREPEDTVRMLLDLGADIHSRNNLGETSLFRAAERGFCRIIEVLMEYGADIHARNKFGRSVLFSAIASPCRGAESVVPSLLRFGAVVHLQDSAGDTALGLAAANGKMDAVKLLLEHGANIHTCNGTGDTALTLAAAREAILEGYCTFEEIHTETASIMAAAMKRSLKTIEILLDCGASVDLKNKAGDTALTLAAATEGNLDAVKLLLEHGANIDTRNGAGDTALTLAAAADATLVEWTDYDWRREIIHNAILTARSIKGNSVIIELLLNHGAIINLKNKAGETALTLAATKGKLDAVKLLLNRGADALGKNEAGDTALSLASQNGHSELHQLLLEHLSEPNQGPVGSDAE